MLILVSHSCELDRIFECRSTWIILTHNREPTHRCLVDVLCPNWVFLIWFIPRSNWHLPCWCFPGRVLRWVLGGHYAIPSFCKIIRFLCPRFTFGALSTIRHLELYPTVIGVIIHPISLLKTLLLNSWHVLSYNYQPLILNFIQFQNLNFWNTHRLKNPSQKSRKGCIQTYLSVSSIASFSFS